MSAFASKPWLACVRTRGPGRDRTADPDPDRDDRRSRRTVPADRSRWTSSGPTTSYGELGEQIDRAAERPALARRRRRRPGGASCCRTARSTSSPSTRCCASAPIVVEHNPLYTDARTAPPVRGPRRHASPSSGTRSPTGRSAFPPDMGVDARSSPSTSARRCRCGKRMALRLPLKKARDARAALTAAGGPRRDAAGETSSARAAARRGTSRAPRSDDIAVLQYTSGTTGTPEGRHADPSEPAGQRRAGPGLGAGHATGRGDLLRASCRCSMPTD